jgi:hypothetical protein
MTQARGRVWLEIALVALTLAAGGVMLYMLLPFITTPDQQLVPPPRLMDLGQTMLTLFIAATAIGAPLTAGLVLVLVAKFVSKRVPATSAAAPDIPTSKAKSRAAEQPQEMSPRQALLWKITAMVLLLIVGGGILAALMAAFLQLYPAGS